MRNVILKGFYWEYIAIDCGWKDDSLSIYHKGYYRLIVVHVVVLQGYPEQVLKYGSVVTYDASLAAKVIRTDSSPSAYFVLDVTPLSAMKTSKGLYATVLMNKPSWLCSMKHQLYFVVGIGYLSIKLMC